MAENLVVNGVTYNGVDSISMQNANGRAVGFYPDAVRYTEQALTEEQKAQARANIGAISEIDKNNIVSEIIDLLGGAPISGTVQADKTIKLKGILGDGTYTFVYEDEDGTITEIGTYEHTYVPEPTYTNILPLAINSDKTPFVGSNGEKGYKSGYRLSSSGTESAEAGKFVTGFIEVRPGCTVYLKNVGWYLDASATGKCYVHAYNASFAKNDDYFLRDNSSNIGTATDQGDLAMDDANNLTAIKIGSYLFGPSYTNVKYIRISAHYIGSDSIITINEPIE